LRKTEFYNDLCRPFDFADWIGSVACHVPDECWIRIGLVGPDFDDRCVDFMCRVVPHIARCLELYQRLRRTAALADMLGDPLDRLPFGVIWLDANAQIVRANRFAERLLGGSEDQTDIGAALRTRSPDARCSLSKAVAAVLDQRGGPVSVGIPRASRKSPLTAIVLPATAEGGDVGVPHARAIVYVVDPERQSLTSEALLRQAFALTPAEARLALCLGRGKVPKEAAAELGISWNTARCQLRQVFAKTRTDRQAALVRLLTSVGVVGEMQQPVSSRD
jgi:DNA-binding CsgD family transcriptional regulator